MLLFGMRSMEGDRDDVPVFHLTCTLRTVNVSGPSTRIVIAYLRKYKKMRNTAVDGRLKVLTEVMQGIRVRLHLSMSPEVSVSCSVRPYFERWCTNCRSCR
jgi:hypothetical protein